MKYRIAYAIACTVDWIDNVVFDHGERQPFIWLSCAIWGDEAYVDRGACWYDSLFWYPLCIVSWRLHNWAAEQCCGVGCVRCS
jgi:hypothetical protein